MKRFHVHLHVDDLNRSIGFYSQLFAAQPARVEGDYAKWMLEDPPVNFAISTRGNKPGIDHLGIQTDDAEELAALKLRAQAADMELLDEGMMRLPLKSGVLSFVQNVDKELRNGGKASTCGIHAGI